MESTQAVEVYSSKGGWKMYSNEIDKLSAALVKAQSVVEGAKKAKENSHFKSKYATLEAVWEAIREPFTNNGLAITQFPCEAAPGFAGLRTVLIHSSGQYLEDRFFMPLKDATNPQAYGSALTYARRYALMSVAGIAPEDDDGNQAAHVDVKGIKAELEASWTIAVNGTVDDMKAVAMGVKNSALPPETKTEILTRYGNAIRERMGK